MTTLRLDPYEIEALRSMLAAAGAGPDEGEPFFGRSALIEASERLTRKAAAAHKRAPKIHLDFGDGAFCGVNGDVLCTANEHLVTCSRCADRIGRQAAARSSSP